MGGSWVTSSPSSTKAWKQQKRAWYAPTVTITLVIGSRSRPSSFPKSWARIFTRGGWPCGARGVGEKWVVEASQTRDEAFGWLWAAKCPVLGFPVAMALPHIHGCLMLRGFGNKPHIQWAPALVSNVSLQQNRGRILPGNNSMVCLFVFLCRVPQLLPALSPQLQVTKILFKQVELLPAQPALPERYFCNGKQDRALRERRRGQRWKLLQGDVSNIPNKSGWLCPPTAARSQPVCPHGVCIARGA